MRNAVLSNALWFLGIWITLSFVLGHLFGRWLKVSKPKWK